MPSPPPSLLAHRARVTELLRADLEDWIHPRAPEFRGYQESWRRFLERAIRPAAHAELRGALERSDVLLIGDYHPDRQAKTHAARWIGTWRDGNRPVHAGLELFAPEEDELLREWSRGRVDEKTLFRESRRARTWDPGGKSFGPFLRWLRREGIRAHGVDGGPGLDGTGLAARDRRAACAILRLRAHHPRARIAALIGEMHLAPTHLPAALRECAARAGTRPPRVVILLQDVEVLYWRSLERGGEERPHLVRLEETGGMEVFCRLHRAPVARLEAAREACRRTSRCLEDGDGSSLVLAYLEAVATHLDAPPPDPSRWTILIGPSDRETLFPRLLPAHRREPLLRRARAGLPVLETRRRVLYLPALRLDVLSIAGAQVLAGAARPERGDERHPPVGPGPLPLDLAAFLVLEVDPGAPRPRTWRGEGAAEAWRRGRNAYRAMRDGGADAAATACRLLARTGARVGRRPQRLSA